MGSNVLDDITQSTDEIKIREAAFQVKRLLAEAQDTDRMVVRDFQQAWAMFASYYYKYAPDQGPIKSQLSPFDVDVMISMTRKGMSSAKLE